MSDLIAKLKAEHPLRAYVENVLGSPYKRGRNYDTHLCFAHDENTPSLQIFEVRWKCFGCGLSGDLLDFIQAYQKVDRKAAIEMLRGSQPIQQQERRTVQPKRTCDYTWLKKQALAASNNFAIALPYMERRAVGPDVALNSWVGATEYKNTIELWTGDTLTFRCQRFTLPNCYTGLVRGINARLDEDDAWGRVGNHQSDVTAIREHHLRKCGKSLRAQEVLYLMFGPKYKRYGNMDIYGQDILYRNGVLRPLSYICVTEGKEIDQMALLTLGFPSVGVPWKRGLNLKEMFSQVRTVYYLQDNDNAGRVRAEWFCKEVEQAKIIKPPADFKDSDEVCIAGEALNWLHGKYNIDPQPQVCQP